MKKRKPRSRITMEKMLKRKKRKKTKPAAAELVQWASSYNEPSSPCKTITINHHLLVQILIWVMMLESEKQLLHKEWWYPYRDQIQILLLLVEVSIGILGESTRRWELHICFCFHQHKQQSVLLVRQEGGHHHRSHVSCLSLNTSWEFAWELLFEWVW